MDVMEDELTIDDTKNEKRLEEMKERVYQKKIKKQRLDRKFKAFQEYMKRTIV